MSNNRIRPRFVSLADAAIYTGLSEKTLRRRISDGTIKGYHHGKRVVRLDLEELAGLFEVIPAAGA